MEPKQLKPENPNPIPAPAFRVSALVCHLPITFQFQMVLRLNKHFFKQVKIKSTLFVSYFQLQLETE